MSKDKVLVIGSGGREHAIARALTQSLSVGQIFCAPGNGGMMNVGEITNLKVTDHKAVLAFIKEKGIKLTVIGPEAPLVDGLADDLRAAGHLVVGASQGAAQLEGSKIFAKNFMAKYGIPSAEFKTFDNFQAAKTFATSSEGKNFKILKADGLAAGKGVYVTDTTEELLAALKEVMKQKKFGAAGEKIVLEEKLEGPEISIIALTDGKTLLPFPSSQDHKRAYDGDKGPNTGGMGAYAPTPFYDDLTRMNVDKHIVQNFLHGLAGDQLDFRGIIYFGLMLTKQGPKVLEFNVRFGDPEAQTILPLVESDLYEAFTGVAKGELSKISLQIRQASACTVVLASKGYPGEYETGHPISGLDEVERKGEVYLCHAGTKKDGDKILTGGGRVLNVTGVGKTLDIAVVRAYQGVKKISFKNSFFRNDIAGKVLKNKNISNRIKRMKIRYVETVTP